MLRMHAPSHPGELMREVMSGLTVTTAAAALGVGRPALSAVLNGKASFSPELALRMEKAFGVSMDLLLKMQLQYDIDKTRKTARDVKVSRFKSAA